MKNKFTVLATILIIGTAVIVGYFMVKPEATPKQLPVINPIDLDEEMVADDIKDIGFGHKIGAFSFVDQDNKVITEKEVKNKIWVAEYFFTTCQTICPLMNVEMQKVQEAFKGDNEVSILSFTVDPKNDTPEKLKTYAVEHHAEDNQWHFLTGEKEKLYDFARRYIFVLKPAEAANLGDAGSDFIHTNNFVLIDQQGRIRGYYDGTNSKAVQQLIKDIKQLKDLNKDEH